MTAEKLEIITGSGKMLNSLILIPEGKERTIVEGDFLSSGIYRMDINMLKRIIRLRAKAKYHKGYEVIYTPITNHIHKSEIASVRE